MTIIDLYAQLRLYRAAYQPCEHEVCTTYSVYDQIRQDIADTEARIITELKEEASVNRSRVGTMPFTMPK